MTTVPTPEPAAAPEEAYVSRIDRRTALTWMGAAAVVGAGGGALALRGHRRSVAPSAAGYGTDPDLLNPVVPWSRIMTPLELQIAAHLCDFFLPANATHPSASALGVPDFINEWVSAPYPDQTADRPVILGGIHWLNDEARRAHGKDLPLIPAPDRAALFARLSAKPLVKLPVGSATIARLVRGPLYYTLFGGIFFLKKFRTLTIGAYYTTQEGFSDIGYVGNVALGEFKGPSDEIKGLLDERLKALGL